MNDELIVRVLSGSAGPQESDALRRWRREAPSHDRYVRELEHVWAATAPPPGRPVPAAAITAAVLQEAEREDAASSRPEVSRIDPPPPWAAPPEATPRRGRVRAVGGAIGLAAVLSALAFGLGRLRPDGNVEAGPSWEAGAAASVTATLPEGSLVRLAPGGRLRSVGGGSERRYALDGSAFFAVAHDARRPFVVEAGVAVVRVVGTRFEIDRTGAAVNTAVVDGSVSVSGPGGAVEIERGAVATLGADGSLVVARPPDVFARLRRPEDALLFQATSLDRVAEDVARRFGRAVTVDPALRTRTVTGAFGSEGFEEVVDALCAVVGAACSVDGAGATLRPRDAARGPGVEPVP